MLYQFDRFEFDDRRSRLYRDGTALQARPKVAALLRHLIRNRERDVPRAELIANLWPGIRVGQTSLSTLINETRQLIHDSGTQQSLISTRPGLGYRFVGKLEVRPERCAKYDVTGVRSEPSWFGDTGIHDQFDRLLEKLPHRSQAPLLIQGEPGSGKSRIADDLLCMAMERQIVCFKIHCSPARTNTRWGAWLEIPEWQKDVPHKGSKPVGSHSTPAPAQGPSRPPHPDPIGPEFVAPKQTVRSMCERILRSVARRGPSLILLEDLHWADFGSLLVLEHLTRAHDLGQLLLVSTTRPPAWLPGSTDRARLRRIQGAHGGRHCLNLPPLSHATIARLLVQRFGQSAPLPKVSSLRRWTGGNPQLVEWLLKGEAGDLLDWAEPGPRPRLSPRLERDLRAWLEPLSPSFRAQLEAAALLGPRFEQRAWSQLTETGPERIEKSIPDLLEAGLIRRTPGHEPHYTFRHGLVRAGLLQCLPPAEHAQIYRRLEQIRRVQRPPTDLNSLAELADHWHRVIPLTGIRPALEWTLRAGHAATQKGEMRAVSHWIRRALEIVESAPHATERRARTAPQSTRVELPNRSG